MSRIPVAILAACAAMLVLLCANRRSARIEDRIERLPAQPLDIASTLDPKTQATRIRDSHLAPVRDPGFQLTPAAGARNGRRTRSAFR